MNLTKKILIAISLFLVSTATFAGTITLTTTASQDNRLAKALTRINAATCGGVGLPANCTQNQARNVQPGTDVYSSVQDMVDRLVLGEFLKDAKRKDVSSDAEAALASWLAKNDAAKDAVCTLFGLPAGCEALPRP